jgi:hypothetical protein
VQFIKEKELIDNYWPLIDKIMAYDLDSIKMVLKNGVPGCGKTTYIKINRKSQQLVMTSGKAAQESYVKWAKEEAKQPDEELKYYRTYDSVNMHGA